MPLINFDAPDASGNKYIKKAINTDFLQMARYAPSGGREGQPTLHLTFEGSIKKFITGSVATDIYQHVQAQPNFIEVSEMSPGNATKLLNIKYVVYMNYRDNTQSEDNESSLTIEYGLDKYVARREPNDPRVGGVDVSSGSSITVKGDEADAIWRRLQGTAL